MKVRGFSIEEKQKQSQLNSGQKERFYIRETEQQQQHEISPMTGPKGSANTVQESVIKSFECC